MLVVSDDTVAGLYAAAFCADLRRTGARVELATFPAGEPHKHLDTCRALWTACAEAAVDRSGTIIALGGGVVGDIAGFVAATWMRGVRFVQVPTTLLAMVDSSVGGKTGINSAAGKNLIGAFWQPGFVLIDPGFLTTMEARDYRAGLAEVVKYGVIREPDFFSWQEEHAAALLERDPATLAHAVACSCECKARYVIDDEREGGVRAHLNYGHTFGHALERETGYATYRHGEAVAIGMHMAAHCAAAAGLLEDEALLERQRALLERLALPLVHPSTDPATLERLIANCGLDKKVRAGAVRFVLPRAMGQVEVHADVDPAAIRQGFAAGLAVSL